MPLAEKLSPFSAEEYLLWEEAADVKHDYIAGEVFAHAGARDSHVAVAMNLFRILNVNIGENVAVSDVGRNI